MHRAGMGSYMVFYVCLSLKDRTESQQVWERGLSCLCPMELGSKARKRKRERKPITNGASERGWARGLPDAVVQATSVEMVEVGGRPHLSYILEFYTHISFTRCDVLNMLGQGWRC